MKSIEYGLLYVPEPDNKMFIGIYMPGQLSFDY
jgi:hypothetical protein